MSHLALLDACILVPQRLSSLLLTLAEDGLYEPRWSGAILDETERALVEKLGLSPDLAGRRLNAMRSAFPEAAVAEFEGLVPSLQCHPKDRHVLAAAITGMVDVLVTNNLKDFPDEACDPYGLEVVDADVFLLGLLTRDGAACRRAILHEADRSRTPAMSVQQLLASLTKVAPTFAHTVYNLWDELEAPISDLPAYVVADEDHSPLAEFGRNPDLTNPLHVAFGWSNALQARDRDLDLLHSLTWSPRAFGDYERADELMADRSFASKVYDAVDDPTGAVAFVRLVPAIAQTSRSFAPFWISGPCFMTMKKRPDDGTWCVWGLGPRMVAAEPVIEG